METPDPINGCSQMHPPKHPPITSNSIQCVEVSVKSLLKNWYRRQQWNQFLNPFRQLLINVPTWRTNLATFLESPPVRVISILLLLVDLVLSVLELVNSCLLSCTSTKNKNASQEPWYHWVGIAILSILSAKTIALAVGLGGSFVRHPVYLADGGAAVGALFMEALLEKRGGGLLVVVSLWRVVRVVESALELSDEAIETQIEGILFQFEALKAENTRLLEIISEKDNVIEQLREELNRRIQVGL
ncbi:hypothetical protein K2173_000461 [Erythroxylum novogranatense]|uniref:Voltage-gated hydrogen channel 1 n=1 Tax=Erythroxylum novogranatense TaxID=1862640 RepID=A0AAV8SWD4_9ROSI|nr:hypothetical protein K2173_000461 [Erythroxylum novogranatense]